jgi:beta-lactamase class D
LGITTEIRKKETKDYVHSIDYGRNRFGGETFNDNVD